MAAATKISLSGLYNVLSGRRAPGRSMLLAIARYPGVDATWLLIGKPSGLPLVRKPLPGPPRAHPRLLDGSTYPVADSLSAPSRYWLELREQDLAVLPESLRLLAGDLLMMETSARKWGNGAERAVGRPCILKVESSSGPEYLLRQVQSIGAKITGDYEGIFALTEGKDLTGPALPSQPFSAPAVGPGPDARQKPVPAAVVQLGQGLLTAVTVLVERAYERPDP